jgi:lysine N6-hydroxylase
MTVPVHDVIGVGLGPFNLGLAALSAPLDLDTVFFEQRPAFEWHPGLLLAGTTLQVPFLADLVTLADPTSPYSFLNYLHERGRLYRFYFYENFLVPRAEFSAYCAWVADRLPGCRFGHRVVSVDRDPENGRDAPWRVTVDADGRTEVHRARAVVAGVGSRPTVPAPVRPHLGPTVVHSAGYRDARVDLAAAGHVTVVGSGQSAAEIVADLLDRRTPDEPLAWFTRGPGFFPMEYSKLGLEHFSPDYTDWFHRLPERRRDERRAGQDLLYKGISGSTSAAIYDRLYERTVDRDDPGLTYAASCAVVGLEPGEGERRHRLTLAQGEAGVTFTVDTDAVVCATGYEPTDPPWSADLAGRLDRDEAGRPLVTRDYRVPVDGRPDAGLFVQNAELHTHGVGAPDLGLGAHRNAVILNALCGRPVYRVRARNVFQSFGPPRSADEGEADLVKSDVRNQGPAW